MTSANYTLNGTMVDEGREHILKAVTSVSDNINVLTATSTPSPLDIVSTIKSRTLYTFANIKNVRQLIL